MQQVGIRELKNQATEILRTVREQGVEYVVTYRGEPVAMLTPISTSATHVTHGTHKQSIDKLLELHPEYVTLRPQNQRLLALLDEWMADVQPEDDAIMDEFDALLAKYPITINSLSEPLE